MIHLDNNSLHSDSQHGFKEGSITTSLLLTITNSMRPTVNDKHITVLLSLSLTKAFDRMSQVHLIHKLVEDLDFLKPTAARPLGSFIIYICECCLSR